MKLAFEIVQEHCKHQGMLKEGKKWCSYKDGSPASCWSDWQVCCEKNCYLVNKNKCRTEQIEQISITDFMKAQVSSND